MPWRPLSGIAFGVCIYPFEPSSPADLPLQVGDELYVIEQGGKDGAWYRGYLVAPPSILAALSQADTTLDFDQPSPIGHYPPALEARVFCGIFPRCCIDIREVLDSACFPYPNRLSISDKNAFDFPHTSPNHVDNDSTSTDNSQSSLALARPTSSETSYLPSSSRHDNPLKPPAPVPLLKIGDETVSPIREPLVDEIASCLREWYSTYLHRLLLSREYDTLEYISQLVHRLDCSRRQLLYNFLTQHELSQLRESAVWDLVTGNRILKGEVIVRSPSDGGRVLTANDSAIELTKLQSVMGLLSEHPPNTSIDDPHSIHHLLIDLSNGLAKLPSIPSLIIALYLCIKPASDAPLQPLSEVFTIDLTSYDSTSNNSSTLLKTLFTDISSTELNCELVGSSLILVFKLLANEPILRSESLRQAGQHNQTTNNPHHHHNNPLKSSNVGSIRVAGGRRSIVKWGRKHGDTHKGENGYADDPTLSSGTHQNASNFTGDQSNSTVNSPNHPSSTNVPPRDPDTLKRTVGAGILRLNSISKTDGEFTGTADMWYPVLEGEMYAEDVVTTSISGSSPWDPLLPEILPSFTGKFRRFYALQVITVSLKCFTGSNPDLLAKKKPIILYGVSHTRKIGFSGAPRKPRSDIYITLNEAWLPNNAHLAHPRTGVAPIGVSPNSNNLELTLEVRRSTGERINNCIYPSCNSGGHTAWRTTAVRRNEPWNITLRLSLEAEIVPGAHIVMSIADAPYFPFALCWMPLWNLGAFTRDGPHELVLYSYDEYSSSMISGRGAYLALPWEAPSRESDMYSVDSSGCSSQTVLATLNLKTYLCSTIYSQDPTLLGLLQWRNESTANLEARLKHFVFVPEIEIVKSLNEVFDTLFDLMIEYFDSVEYEDLIFNALVFVLSIVQDRRFKLGPIVDHYAETRFKYPVTTFCLIHSFQRLLGAATDAKLSRILRSAIKVGSHIFKFIMYGRAQQCQNETDPKVKAANQRIFLQELRGLFTSSESLISSSDPLLVGTRTLIVQHIHGWLNELEVGMPPRQIFEIASSFVESCSNVTGKLILYKFVMLISFIQIPAFRNEEVRYTLLQSIASWIAPYWGSTDSISNQWRDQVRLCCSIVAEQEKDLCETAHLYLPKIIESYLIVRDIVAQEKKDFGKNGTGKTKRQLSLLFPKSYPFPTRTTDMEAEYDESLIELAGVLAQVSKYQDQTPGEVYGDEYAHLLFCEMEIFKSVLKGDVYPSSWLSIHIYYHRTILTCLSKMAETLTKHYLPPVEEAEQFNTSLWRCFFETLIKLVGSPALALETFPEQKRRAVWKIGGDIRELGAELLGKYWEIIGWEVDEEERISLGYEKIGGYQVQYVPTLVAPVVELCLSVHEGLRLTSVSVLKSMIISEWNLNDDLSLLVREIIKALGGSFKHHRFNNDSNMQRVFIDDLTKAFEPTFHGSEESLCTAVKQLLGTVNEAVTLLLAVHNTEGNSEFLYTMAFIKLINFMGKIDEKELYISYVHELEIRQAKVGNYCEAGLALEYIAKLYEWNTLKYVPATSSLMFPRQTMFERKEMLYLRMIKYFEKSESWEFALSKYNELTDQYGNNVFDFAKLAQTQRSIATICERIEEGKSIWTSRYFRVEFKGTKFPSSIKDKEFIFQTSGLEKSSTFVDRMQRQYRNAEVVLISTEEIASATGGLMKLRDETKQPSFVGQRLVISPVAIHRNLNHKVYRRYGVSHSTRDFMLVKDNRMFSVPVRKSGANKQSIENGVEKVVFETAEAFPTILRCSRIVSTQKVTISPIQSATERIYRKTGELVYVGQRISEHEGSRKTFLDLINSLVSPNSEVGCVQYRKFLPKSGNFFQIDDEEEALDEKQNEEEWSDDQVSLSLALIDHTLSIRKALKLIPDSINWSVRQKLNDMFESTFMPELALIKQDEHYFTGDMGNVKMMNERDHDGEVRFEIDEHSVNWNSNYGQEQKRRRRPMKLLSGTAFTGDTDIMTDRYEEYDEKGSINKSGRGMENHCDEIEYGRNDGNKRDEGIGSVDQYGYKTVLSPRMVNVRRQISVQQFGSRRCISQDKKNDMFVDQAVIDVSGEII